MKILNVSKILAKIAEVCHWVGAGLMLIAVICSQAAPEAVKYFADISEPERDFVNLNIYGFAAEARVINGAVDMNAFLIFGIGCFLILGVMAMVFRDLYLIIKNAEKSTPFVKDNIRMLKEISIFSFAVPIIGLIISIIYRAAFPDITEISVNFYSFFVGIAMLCLTQFFIYGAKLEKDVDGIL